MSPLQLHILGLLGLTLPTFKPIEVAFYLPTCATLVMRDDEGEVGYYHVAAKVVDENVTIITKKVNPSNIK